MTSRKELARQERGDFIAFLNTLEPGQWDAASLCTGWRVRDVAAHVISYDRLGFGEMFGRLARSRFGIHRANAAVVNESADESLAKLKRALNESTEPRGVTAAFGSMIGLLDALIHHQDIRRPLGLPREVPADRLAEALPLALKAPPLGARRRVKGLRLVATDIDFTSGSGPEVSGSGEALLMAIAGRSQVVGELTGPGQPILAERIQG